MSREKQIEEMAKATIKHCEIDNQCGSCHWSTCNECLAEVLYNAGYRKQSEGEWVVEERPLVHDKKISCSCCGYSERRGPAWNISWGVHSFCPNCGAKMKGGAE